MNDKQKRILDIYKEFSRICDQHNLKYWATGGTVLGSVRHSGFIPWDDDIDVAMKREEFDTLKQMAHIWLPEYLVLLWSERNQSFRLIDTRTSVVCSKEYAGLFDKNELNGLFIDIQPFDGAPANSFIRVLHCGKVFFWRACIKTQEKERVYKGKRPLFEKILIVIFGAFSNFFSKMYLIDRYDKLMRRYKVDNSLYIADYVGKYLYKDVYPSSWWFPLINHKFEDVTIPIPGGYDNYLKQVYGNYMLLPDERISHFVDN